MNCVGRTTKKGIEVVKAGRVESLKMSRQVKGVLVNAVRTLNAECPLEFADLMRDLGYKKVIDNVESVL